MNKNKDYLITEKPSRALFAFALPMIIGNLFQQAYTIVDSAIVGHYVGPAFLSVLPSAAVSARRSSSASISVDMPTAA